jgi:hypothetical protein
MAHLAMYLLGPFYVTLDGKSVTGFEYDKVQALLTYRQSKPPARTAEKP